ncbi:hypothetical protein rpr22_0796 [Rickettsia prowazekii str. Rp22]|uniref:Uncharacterized protein n=1 Tax=Rickettsia prowazekii (strain Rp22) TaxID=449216 RepID=D5AY14_RICPP|nr:hypothetical protein rpr22_0796 [Rickettsia prowazekii str. Rp22]AGJ03003.1 Ribosomal RNA small subunit methyltransferase I [Rickettsia prowazekii str. Breinl]AMS12625.1 endonuclease III [Rickettsia prowazekii]EOB09316.1 Endonuclease III [Rickettsia prowazekii str. Cairo 3]
MVEVIISYKKNFKIDKLSIFDIKSKSENCGRHNIIFEILVTDAACYGKDLCILKCVY